MSTNDGTALNMEEVRRAALALPRSRGCYTALEVDAEGRVYGLLGSWIGGDGRVDLGSIPPDLAPGDAAPVLFCVYALDLEAAVELSEALRDLHTHQATTDQEPSHV